MRIIILICIVFSNFLTFGQKAKPDSLVNWLLYKDSIYHFSIPYPADWSLRNPSEKEKAKIFIRSPKENEIDSFIENINIMATPINLTSLTGKQIQQSIKPSLQNRIKDFKIIKESFPVSNNVESYWIEYIGKLDVSGEEKLLKSIQLILFKNKTLYTVTFVAIHNASLDLINKAQKMLQGFKVLIK